MSRYAVWWGRAASFPVPTADFSVGRQTMKGTMRQGSVPKVLKVSKVRRVSKVSKVLRVSRVSKVLRVSKVSNVSKVLRAPKPLTSHLRLNRIGQNGVYISLLGD